MQMSSCMEMIPGNLSVMLSILFKKTSYDNLRPKGILKNLHLPLRVLKVVK